MAKHCEPYAENPIWVKSLSDVHTPAQRSYNMSRIRGKNTRPELILRSALWKQGLRYRTSGKLRGRPDIIFTKAMVVVFIDGCFWHACPKHLIWPKNNMAFWKAKIMGNKLRDEDVTSALKCGGWKVIRLWEHDVRTRLDWCVAKIVARVTQKKRIKPLRHHAERPILRFRRP
jgi:DNA mismatch endonuclease, patch repair protein